MDLETNSAGGRKVEWEVERGGVFPGAVGWGETVVARAASTANLSCMPASSWPPRPVTPGMDAVWATPAAPAATPPW